MKKILIIEDDEADYILIASQLQKYPCTIYPSTVEQFKSFSKKVVRFANEERNELPGDIIEIIYSQQPSIILLDLNLANVKDNQSGLKFKEFFDSKMKDVKQIIISSYGYNRDIPCDGWISKKATKSLESQVYEVVGKPFLIVEQGEQPPLTGSVADATFIHNKKDFEKLSKKIAQPKILDYVSDLENYKIAKWVSFFLDKIFSYSFYLLLIFLFLSAPIFLVVKILHREELIRIAEYCFIAFLPFLITCGFFIFYKKSLRPYFINEEANPRTEDFESASTLMTLTKKLFVSSLISYLFIKLIELLCFTKSEIDTSFFQSFYNTKNQFLQLYILAGLLILLISYYIYINAHNKK